MVFTFQKKKVKKIAPPKLKRQHELFVRKLLQLFLTFLPTRIIFIYIASSTFYNTSIIVSLSINRLFLFYFFKNKLQAFIKLFALCSLFFFLKDGVMTHESWVLWLICQSSPKPCLFCTCLIINLIICDLPLRWLKRPRYTQSITF